MTAPQIPVPGIPVEFLAQAAPAPTPGSQQNVDSLMSTAFNTLRYLVDVRGTSLELVPSPDMRMGGPGRGPRASVQSAGLAPHHLALEQAACDFIRNILRGELNVPRIAHDTFSAAAPAEPAVSSTTHADAETAADAFPWEEASNDGEVNDVI